MEQTADEVSRLQGCINDLISVLALPAMWSGQESAQIVSTLLDVLVGMLRLDFAYARLIDPAGKSPIEMLRLAQPRNPPVRPQEVGQVLKTRLGDDRQKWPVRVRNPVGDGDVSIMPLRLGLRDKIGVIVAGSQRADFPGETERLLLSVVANQAAIGLQEARLLGEQKRVAEELDQRVAERTSELLVANEQLEKEIAERKRAEQKLRRSEAYLAEAQRLTHTGSFARNVAPGRLTHSSDEHPLTHSSAEHSRLYGFDPEKGIPTSEEFRQRIHPEDRDSALEKFERAVAERTDVEVDFRTVLPDGTIKNLHAISNAVFNTAGDLAEYVGTVMDVTEQHEARAALEKALAEIKQSEAQLRAIIDAIPTQVWCALPDGSTEFQNRRWLNYAGLSAEEARGWGWRDAIHPDDAESYMNKWLEIKASQASGEAEARFRRFDGEYRRFLMRVDPVRDEQGNIVKWYGTNTDIEDRKQAEEALRRSEAYLAEAQRLTHTGSWVQNVATGERTHSSEEFCRLYGFDPERGVPSDSEFRQRIHREDLDRVVETYKRAVAERTDFEIDYRIALPDGTIRYLHSIGHPVFNAAGDLVEYIGSQLDVTERKRAEEAVLKAQSELAHVTRVATLGEMTASISHEINQPLGAMVNNANACLRWLAAAKLEEARQSAMLIAADGYRAGEIIARIRALAQKAPPRKDWLDINKTIQEVITLTRSEVQGNHVSLKTRLGRNVPPILGDRIQLQQVLLNLMMNAIEAMRGIDEGLPRELWVDSEEVESTNVFVAVRDSGPGLDAESLNRLFETFYTTKPEGLGMGLAISRSIIEAHGGRLWATANAPHGGAVFQFTLPIGSDSVS
jgi:PAS domain S-box-containing protein